MSPIGALIDLYSLIVLAAVVLSWFPIDKRSGLAIALYRLTEPAFAAVRRLLPPMGGLDLSPMVLLIALRLLRRLF